MYETPEALTRYLPEEYRRDVQFVQVGRRTRIAILGKITEFIPNPTFERVAAPGAHEAFYAGTNTAGKSLRELTGAPMDSIPAFREPGPRIESLNAQGVTEAFVYPTLANLVEHSAAEEPELVVAMIHALNRWMLDTWGYTHENRLFMTPVVTLALVEEAQRELEYVLEHGAKAILIKPAPVKGLRGWRSPALPEFDPFWRDVQDAGVPVFLHASQPPLDEYVNRWEPPKTNNFMDMSAFRWVVLGHREISDMIAALICHGTLTRFPPAADRQHRERVGLDPRADRGPQRDLRQDAAGVRRAPGRGTAAQLLGQPVLGGLGRRGRRVARLGQGHVRLGLPAPGGAA